MKSSDILRMCAQSLRRRKGRTVLTVLGVVIGCCAIVIMMSIGVGMKQSQDKMLEQMGDLTVIQVSQQYGGADVVKLDDAALESFRNVAGVEAVTPSVYFNYGASVSAGLNGRYRADWANIIGMDMEAIELLGYELTEGEFPTSETVGASLNPDKLKFNVLVGENFAYNFADTMRPEGNNRIDRWMYMDYETGEYSDDLPDPYINPMDATMTMTIDTGEKQLTVELVPVGIMKEDYSKSYETGEGIIMSYKDMQTLTLKLEGKKTKDFTYDSAIVKTYEIDEVAAAEDEIALMGYYTSSMESIREPMQEEARQQQLVLGGIGAISLFVAALGITNTMIMSITERTREIGIMKALGCYVKNIRVIFLSEAGAIGLIGGLVGCVLSFLISTGINVVSLGPPLLANLIPAITGAGDVSRVSVIPFWLYCFSIVFSIAIGLISGVFPANKAVRISALEAIKND